jgi:hypothetical protein
MVGVKLIDPDPGAFHFQMNGSNAGGYRHAYARQFIREHMRSPKLAA